MELAVLGSASKLTTGGLNQKTEGKLIQGDSSLFTALFQGLTLSNNSEEQLPNLGQDDVEAEEMLAALYNLMKPNQLSLEDVVAKFQGLSTDKQQDISQALTELLVNQNNTFQAGELKGFNFNEFKTPRTNNEELAILIQEMGKQANSYKLNAEKLNVQNDIPFNQLGNSNLVNLNSFNLNNLKNLDFNNLISFDLGDLNSLDRSKFNSLDLSKLGNLDLSILKTLESGILNSTDLNQGVTKFNNDELATILKGLIKSEQTVVNNSAENTKINLEGVSAQQQKGYSSFISNLLNNSNNQSVMLNTQTIQQSKSDQKVDVEVVDLTKAELQVMKMNVDGDVNRLEATNKQENIEHLATNRNFTEELGKIMIKSFKLPDGTSETKIQLHPQELGQIQVKLVANNGQISAQLITETALGKELLEGQISQLRQSLIQQGYQVDRIEVQQAPSSSNLNNDFKGSSSFNFAGQNSSRQFNRENPNNRYSQFSEDVDEFVQEMLNVTGIDYTV